jgi:DNA repair ATPase RecN
MAPARTTPAHTTPTLSHDAVASPEQIAQSLATLLERAQQQWQAIAELSHRQQAALRSADHAALGALLDEQARITPELKRIEQSRRELAALAQRTLPPLRSNPHPKLSHIAHALGPQHAALAHRATALRALATQASQQLAALRLATSNLAVHVETVIRQVSQALSADGTYTRRGDVRASSPALAIDLSS